MSMRRAYPTPSYQGDGSKTADTSAQTSAQTHELLEKENDELVYSLKKKLAIDIGDEAKTHNTFLQGMDSDFDNTGGLLKGSMKRLKGLASAGHNNWMCYMILLIIVVFLILYYVIKWRN